MAQKLNNFNGAKLNEDFIFILTRFSKLSVYMIVSKMFIAYIIWLYFLNIFLLIQVKYLFKCNKFRVFFNVLLWDWKCVQKSINLNGKILGDPLSRSGAEDLRYKIITGFSTYIIFSKCFDSNICKKLIF